MQGQVHPSHTLSEKLFQHLHALKDQNNMTEAYLVAARALGLNDLEHEFTHINLTQNRVGHLSLDLNQKRHTAYLKLVRDAKSMLAPEQHRRLYLCF